MLRPVVILALLMSFSLYKLFTDAVNIMFGIILNVGVLAMYPYILLKCYMYVSRNFYKSVCFCDITLKRLSHVILLFDFPTLSDVSK